MRFFGSKSSIVESIELQGDHSVAPPSTSLMVSTVNRWLQSMRYKGPAVQLQIECRRMPAAKGFYGVRALHIPDFNPCSIEILVRVKGDTHQWHCHLILPDSETAEEIYYQARPVSVNLSCSLVKLENKQRKLSRKATPNGTLNKARTKPIHQEERQRERLRSILSKKSSLYALCAYLEELVPWTMPPNPIKKSTMYGAFSHVLDAEVDQRSLDLLLLDLLDLGIVDAKPGPEGKGTLIIPTPIVPEYATVFHERKKEDQLESLRRELETLQKLREGSQKEQERLQNQLQKEHERSDSLEARIMSLEEQITSLEATSFNGH